MSKKQQRMRSKILTHSKSQKFLDCGLMQMLVHLYISIIHFTSIKNFLAGLLVLLRAPLTSYMNWRVPYLSAHKPLPGL